MSYLYVLIHPAVFICQFEQEGELLHSSGRKFTSGHQLHIPSHPVPHQPLLSSVFRWPPVVLLHKCHHFVVSGLPAFGLGHRRLYGRCAQNSCSGKRLLRRRAIRKLDSKLYRSVFFILTRMTTNFPLIFAARKINHVLLYSCPHVLLSKSTHVLLSKKYSCTLVLLYSCQMYSCQS